VRVRLGGEEALDRLLIDASQRWKERRSLRDAEARRALSDKTLRPGGGGSRDQTSPVVRAIKGRAAGDSGGGASVESLHEK
jgi:hypothetical protein